MFEKFQSYAFRQIIQEEMKNTNEDEQVFLLPITIHEKDWLYDVLQLEEASFFLSEETIEKLKRMVINDITELERTESVIEKGQSTLDKEQMKTFVQLTQLTNIMVKRQAIECRTLNNTESEIILPIKLEYSLKTGDWNVSGVKISPKNHEMATIRLQQIRDISTYTIDKDEYSVYCTSFFNHLRQMREKATIRLNRNVFIDHPIEDEKLRILYAFSSFDKEVMVNDEDDRFYEITLYYYQQDFHQLLSVIQLLGKRIEVIAPVSLRKTVKEIAELAFKQYTS